MIRLTDVLYVNILSYFDLWLLFYNTVKLLNIRSMSLDFKIQ